MNIDPAAVLALISTLTAENARLAAENTQLRAEVEQARNSS